MCSIRAPNEMTDDILGVGRVLLSGDLDLGINELPACSGHMK